jgi:cellobiose phosphorylase
MRYGHFDDDLREYVITRPDTPLPWINYLGDEDYFGIISNTAGGYSFYRDARLRRLTRYRYNNVPTDAGGRYLYLRDDDSGEFWSPSWQPTRTDLEDYRCRHGLGYTVISSARLGIEAETSYLVPRGEALELWRTVVTNHRRTPARLSLFSCVEFALWDAWDDATNLQRNLSTGEVEVEGAVIYHTTEYRERRDHFAFFACSVEPAGFDTRREAFLGPYRGWDRPVVVEAGQATGSIAHGWAPIGSHHLRLPLASGEARAVSFVLGYHENPPESKFAGPQVIEKSGVRRRLARWLQPGAADRALADLRAHWDELLRVLRVSTPDPLVNIWNPYQNMATGNLSRSASGFDTGVGRGMGFRDSNQDVLGYVHMAPGRARQRLLDLAATQLPDGGAYHQYQPLTKRGNEGVGGGFNDDPLWLVLAAAAYLKETGDASLLDEDVVFANRPGTEAPLREHLARAVGYTLDRLGPHRLPLIGRADWNDCLNLNTFSAQPGESFQTHPSKEGGVAESVFIAGLFVLAAGELAEMEARWGGRERARARRDEAAAMARRVLDHGWDGEWFLRAYDHFGGKVGSAECDEGRIYVEPQGICVMAGIGVEEGRARRALDSVRDHLATPHGILLLDPAYTRYHLELGEITSYPPGYKENGSVFSHTNPWVMVAEAILGDGDAAFDYYRRLNPSVREAISEVHRAEPYVYAQTIAGRSAPTFGEAKNSWLTGSAAWNYVAITQWILGIRPDYDGLIVHPVLPSSWEGFRAVRRFRGSAYHIEARRQGPGRAVSLVVDGVAQQGDLVAARPAGGEVAVEAIMG